MKLLLLLHVLSAIIGIGPTFFIHVLIRPNKTIEELQVTMKLMKGLELFPKIGGSIAVLSGFVLFWIGDYGTFTQIWLAGSLLLYIIIQILVIGLITPRTNRVNEWLILPENVKLTGAPPVEIQHHLVIIHRYFYLASSLGVLLFIFMILKP